MGTREERGGRTCGWSVFDGVRSLRPAATTTFSVAPEALMAEIDAAVAALEHAHSTALLRPFGRPTMAEMTASEAAGEAESSPSSSPAGGRAGHDAAGLADEAYRSACAALAAGKPDSALRSLRVALASCPPDKASAISKLRSLVAFATSQQQRLHQHKSQTP